MIDQQRISDLIKLLGINENPMHDGKVTRELISIGNEAVPQLIEALSHPNAAIRSGAALILGAIKDERAVEPLIAALNDIDSWTRDFASTSLSLHGDRRAIEPLLIQLKQGTTYGVAEALARFGDNDFVEPIIAALYADAEQVRQWESEEEDNDVYTRTRLADFFSRSHIRALTTFDDSRVIPPLIEAISSEDVKVFDPAFYALKERGGNAVEHLIQAFNQPLADRSRIVWLLGEIGDVRAFDLIITALNDPDKAVQHDAITALGDLKDRRAIPILLEYRSHLPSEEKWAITTVQKVLEELGYEKNKGS